MSHSVREYLQPIQDETTYLLRVTIHLKKVDFIHDETFLQVKPGEVIRLT